jgi:hypothetical protein
MERGSAWPANVARGGEGLVVLRQEVGEPAAMLRRRALDRVAGIERSGNSVARAVLSCGVETSVEAEEERAEMAHVLLSAVRTETHGALLLVGAPDAPRRLRHSLLELAGMLTETLGGSSACVSLVFEERRAPLDVVA